MRMKILPKLKPPKANVKITERKNIPPIKLNPVAFAGYLKHYCAILPHPNTRGHKNLITSIMKRAGCDHPIILEKHIKPLKNKTIQVLERLGVQKVLYIMSRVFWLANSGYSLKQIVKLINEWNEYENLTSNWKLFVCECFGKMEFYDEFKYPRGIFSRSNLFKLWFGPLIKTLEEEIYKLTELNQFFIKHVPHLERPAFLKKRFGQQTGPWIATDFSAFESQFTPIMMDCVENQAMRWLISELADKEQYIWVMENVIAGSNLCSFNTFDFQCEATRMSGEMTTSLFNGLTNLVTFLYVSEDMCGNTEVVGVVEGDDGLFTCKGGRLPTSADFAEIGMTIKIEIHENFNTASFCGCIFDIIDERILTNPIKTILKIAWSPMKLFKSNKNKKLSYLKCKLMSAKTQYPGAPMIDAFATASLQQLKKYDYRSSLKFFDKYTREKLITNVQYVNKTQTDKSNFMFTYIEPSDNSRKLVCEKFGVTVEQQIRFEDFCKTKLSVFDPNWSQEDFDACLPQCWLVNYEEYAVDENCIPDHWCSSNHDGVPFDFRRRTNWKNPTLKIPDISWFDRGPILTINDVISCRGALGVNS